MNDAHLGQPSQKYSDLVIALILAFPIIINSVKIVSSLILLILLGLGIYIALKNKQNPFKIPELKLFSYLTVGYFGVMLLSGLVADGLNYDFHHLGRKLQFLLAPLIALAIFRIDIPLNKLLLSFKIGLIIIGVVTTSQYFFQLGEEWARPAGMMNPNIFGDITVAMLFLSITKVFTETPKEQVTTLIGAICGVVAIILSGSRGSWVSMLILSVVWFVIIYKQYLYNNTKLKLVIFGLFTAMLLLASSTQIVQNKITTAITGVQGWHTGDGKLSSTGERLNMWTIGLEVAKKSPWIGYGYRNANDAVQKYTQQDVGYTHLHNEYITNLVSAGAIGLLSLLALLFIPLRIFYKKLKNENAYYYASMGVLLSVSYITFGFTHIAFGEEHVNAFYVLFLGLLLPRVIPSKSNLP
jgi:O-antigen ligase